MSEISEIAKDIRKKIYMTAHYAGGGHMGASFSMADIISVLYFGNVLRYDAKNPEWEERDKFILSKGHACYALYAALAKAGYYPEEELWNVGKPGSKFGGHPKMHDIPGVEASTGALGHGLSFAIGIAYANKRDKKDSHVYVVLGDGECQEGSVWEGALSAPTLGLDNMTVIVDHNKLQAMDDLEKIVHMKPFADKWRAFGWNVVEIDGHDYGQIKDGLLVRAEGKPTLIVANTIKGKGVSFMENVPIWHYRMPNEEEIPVLMEELGLTEADLEQSQQARLPEMLQKVRGTQKGRDHIAGNIYSEKEEGIDVHKYGPHIFHTDKGYVWKYVNRFAEFNHFVYSPVANYKGEIYNLPFNMNTFAKMWPDVTTPEQAWCRIADQVKAAGVTVPKNLEEQAISMVGTDIYEKLVKGYTQKQWGRPCTELPAFIIKRLPVRMTFDNNYFNHPYQGIPKAGYTSMVEAMLDGAEVELGVDFLHDKSRLASQAETIIYTGPIDEYYGYCFGALQYRSLRFETEVLDIPNYQGVAGMNYTDTEHPYTRIIEHKHFLFGAGNPGKTVITREYPAEWKCGDEPYYPVNDMANGELYRRYEELSKKENNLRFGGRLGTYRYLDMDQVIMQAMEDAER